MKKKLALLLLVIACYVVNAQNPNACPPDAEIIDTTYPYYLFEHPCRTDGVMGNSVTHEIFDEENLVEFRGVRYVSQEPVLVYGIACMGEPNLELGRLAVAIIGDEGNLVYLTSSLSQNHYERGPHRFMYLRCMPYDTNAYDCVAIHEQYFKAPVLVKDTFYVGFVIDTHRYSGMDGTGFPFGVVSDTIIRHGIPYENVINWGQGRRFYPYATRTFFWGGAFPIIHPYDGDSLVCDPVKNFHLVQRGPSYPTFAWDTSSQWEQDWFQLQYAPYGSGNWRTVETTEPSLRVVASFDPSIYYQARIRAVCHHVCPGHDTVLYSTWSDTIRFYTGSTEPTDITLVEGRADLFTLMPNPAHGEVTVELGGSVDGKGVLTLTDGLGREVLWQSAVDGQQSVVSISLKEFPSGVYFVTLRTEKYTATRKLVVEN